MKSDLFSEMELNPALLQSLQQLKYQQMTQVQAQSLPAMLAGENVIVQAQTGSGKTAAFALALLQSLQVKRFAVQALVLCPTRELAEQVAGEIRRLASALGNIKVLTLCGGVPFHPQSQSLQHGTQVVVGTPGRVDEHLRKGTLNTADLGVLVLDEADRMLDMGFQDIIHDILKQLPKPRQNMLFSATYPENIAKLANHIMTDAQRITVVPSTRDMGIEEIFHPLAGHSRNQAVTLVLLSRRPDSAIVFCNTKKEVDQLTQELLRCGVHARALHGDLEQKDRDITLVLFANQSISVLVATDVAARGLDIEAVDVVINFQLARDNTVHTHRIGRTGRAGAKGVAVSMFEPQEKFKLDKLAAENSTVIAPTPLPDAAVLRKPGYSAPHQTLQIDGGKKQKLRAGDILGALTAEGELSGDQIGKIVITESRAFVAIKRKFVDTAFSIIRNGKVKGRSYRCRLVD